MVIIFAVLSLFVYKDIKQYEIKREKAELFLFSRTQMFIAIMIDLNSGKIMFNTRLYEIITTPRPCVF